MRRFRLLVPVELGLSVGVWIIVLAAQWMLTVAGESATMVAAVQVAVSLPFFLFGLPIGAIADVAGHRRLLVLTSTVLAIASGAAAVLAFFDLATAPMLMATVFIAGTGMAVMAIVWQALLPHLVDRRMMTVVPAFDGAVFNGARAVGPVIGGAILAAFGGMTTFAAVAAVFAVCALIAAWQVPRDAGRGARPASWTQHIATATRFIRHSVWMRTLLVLIAAFGLPSSALWALLPLVADHRLNTTTFEFGLVSGAIGVGAVVGTFALMPLRRRMSWSAFIALGAAAYAVVLLGMGLATNIATAFVLMVIGGAAWVAVQSTWMVAAHQVVPGWVRAQALGIIILIVQAVQAAGALLWGVVVDRLGLVPALVVSAAMMGAASILFLRVRIRGGSDLVPEPLMPVGAAAEDAEQGYDSGRRVMIETTYQVRPEARATFIEDMRQMRLSRLRLGALECVVWEERDRPGTFLELTTYFGWADHVAQERERLTVPEGRVRERLNSHLTSTPLTRVLGEPAEFSSGVSIWNRIRPN